MDATVGADVRAEGLGLKGPRGWAFHGITLEAEPGSLIAIEGPSGSGRTSLLLALTGRMKPTEGVATVAGFKLPRHMAGLRRVSAVANVSGVTDLEPALTVGEHLRERALLQRRFEDSLRELLHPRAQRAHEARLRVDAALAAAGLDLETLPKGSRTAVRDLERPQEVRLSLALALLGRPRLLGVDDIDMKLSAPEREGIWDTLRSLTRAGTTVVAVCRAAPGDCLTVRTGGTRAERHKPGPENGSGNTPGDTPANEPRNTPEAGPGNTPANESGKPEPKKEEAGDALTEAGRA
ncbi:ATP-binding cassette domain-containing protein [Streptomyces cyanogenus]|uniref:ABC transporter ATP-binding protein n=1 Tax=Streptomyces cyanogenus TaxID=80860 RepID=A0ABX7TMN4_STRCY|nr:ATP-binding cassette domain-containing protein [Streptomyces cyanogenus]QTD97985.1 putative ABC transporter ATP-binding protein [Streptomyces cyanogenus]